MYIHPINVIFSAVFFLFIFVLGTTEALSTDIESVIINRIENYKSKSKLYWDTAYKIDDNLHLGTAVNEIDVPAHSCAILAELLNIIIIDNKFNPVKDPGIKSKDAYQLRLYGLFLTNYTVNAIRILKLDNYSRKYSWNLNCVGRFGISKSMQIAGIKIEPFSVENEGNVLRILGDIKANMYGQFLRELEKHSQVKYIGLGSAGGSVKDALQIGYKIRKLGLSTVLWDDCYSACSLVFLGGVKRLIYSPYPKLGFHRASSKGKQLDDNSQFYKLIKQYGRQMIGNGNTVVDAMQSAGINEMYEFDLNLICDFKVATWVQRVCF